MLTVQITSNVQPMRLRGINSWLSKVLTNFQEVFLRIVLDHWGQLAGVLS